MNDFVIEHGTVGDEFYIILEGECEVIVPDRNIIADFNNVNFEIKDMKRKL